MGEKIDKLNRKIISNSKYDLELFMYLPSISISQSNTASVSFNPILNLRHKPSKSLTEAYDYSKSTFKITPRNLFTIINFFNNIMKWFYDDNFSDLFLNDENGNIIFNADYNKLSESTPRGDFDQCIMQAVPTIVQYGDRMYEGIHLYINSVSNCITLTYQEVTSLFSVLKDFSFPNEVVNMITAYEYAKNNNRYMDSFNYSNKKNPFDN